jgi:hypothetical protein
MAIRRLQKNAGGKGGENSVAVLMRYTLRLLTLQQFQRAATLICACEQIRFGDATRWGETSFRLGLWVRRKTTPNRTSQSAEVVETAQRETARGRIRHATSVSGISVVQATRAGLIFRIIGHYFPVAHQDSWTPGKPKKLRVATLVALGAAGVVCGNRAPRVALRSWLSLFGVLGRRLCYVRFTGWPGY